MTNFIARSSYADIHLVKETGEIIKIDYAAMGGTDEWDDVERFDPASLTSEINEDDVNYLRFYGKDGTVYDPAENEVEPEAGVTP